MCLSGVNDVEMESKYNILNNRTITSVHTRYKTVKEHGRMRTDFGSVVLVINYEPFEGLVGLITNRDGFVDSVNLMKIKSLRVRNLIKENMNRNPNYYIFGDPRW